VTAPWIPMSLRTKRTRRSALLGLILAGAVVAPACRNPVTIQDFEKPAVNRTHLAIDVAEVASTYYVSFGHWPSALEDLQELRLDQVSEGRRESFSNSVREIPWEALKGKWTLKEMPDGSLCISMPPLEPPSSGGAGTMTVQKPTITNQ